MSTTKTASASSPKSASLQRFLEIAREVYTSHPNSTDLTRRIGPPALLLWKTLVVMMSETHDADLVVAYLRSRCEILEESIKRLRAEGFDPNAALSDLDRPGGGRIM